MNICNRKEINAYHFSSIVSFFLLLTLILVIIVQLLFDNRPDVAPIIFFQRVYTTDIFHNISNFIRFFDLYADVVPTNCEDYLKELSLWLFDPTEELWGCVKMSLLVLSWLLPDSVL